MPRVARLHVYLTTGHAFSAWQIERMAQPVSIITVLGSRSGYAAPGVDDVVETLLQQFGRLGHRALDHLDGFGDPGTSARAGRARGRHAAQARWA